MLLLELQPIDWLSSAGLVHRNQEIFACQEKDPPRLLRYTGYTMPKWNAPALLKVTVD